MAGSADQTPVGRLASDLEAKVFRVGPNAVLSNAGFMVEGEDAQLRHVEDFKTFVFNTSAAVATVLSILFPTAVAVPTKDGRAEPSNEEAWQHFSRHAMLVRTGDADQILRSGRVVLQWCLAANCVATLTQHDVLQSTDFLPVRQLLTHGGAALPCSVERWEAYLRWDRNSFTAFLSGRDHGRDPRPTAISVAIPWLEDLGVDLGGPGKAFENACQIASDVVVIGEEAHLRVSGHRVLFNDASHLIAMFNAVARQEQDQHTLSLSVKGVQVRATRVPCGEEEGKDMYCFRLLMSLPESLETLINRGGPRSCGRTQT